MFDFILGNRYRLISPLGEGGMASVYVATDERLGRKVAIKVLSDKLLGDNDFVQRFQHEAEAAAKLSHPNIVSVYDVGEDGDRQFIVMELVAGRNLKEMIQDRGAFPSAQVVALGSQILDGLGYAHQHGLIHRDIKPQNVLVTRDGIAKLGDFGIAKAVDASSATQTAMVLGSAHYLSPEQAAGEPATPQSDLYSAGVVLFEMATGCVPYDGTNLLAVASRHLNDNVPRASAVAGSVPRELDDVISRAMSKIPAERFESALEMRAALGEVPGDGRPHEAPGDTLAIQPLSKPERPNEVLTARPSVLTHVFWAFLVAVAAVAVNRGSLYLPAVVTQRLTGASLAIISGVVGVLAVLVVIMGFVERYRHRYTVDAHAVTVETGLFAHHRDAIPLPAIINLQLHQNPVARLFDMGTIVLTTVQLPGQGPISLQLVEVGRASQIYEAILKRISGGPRLRYDTENLAGFGPA